MTALLAILVAILGLVSLALMAGGERRYSSAEYYFRAKEGGLTLSEARYVRDTARLAGLDDPAAALWSPRELDVCIGAVRRRLRAQGRDRDRDALELLEKLYEFRRKLEFDQPRYKQGIRGSRQIAQGTKLRLLVHGLGVFDCALIDNTERYLVVSSPSSAIGGLPRGFTWKGRRVSVYFWRQEDAGYVFDTYVIDELSIRGASVVHVAHGEALFRTQKRKSVRARSSIPAYLYIMKRLEGAYEKPESQPGMRCVVQDLSDDGFAVLIGGKGKEGLQIKTQFFLDEEQVVMSGVVRSIDWYPDRNRSVLHVEALKPSPRVRDVIRSYVYEVASPAAPRRASVYGEENVFAVPDPAGWGSGRA
ncbi:MAG: PilZ domain-containing protein [Spirochaetia bacterium]|nr:PilZ domain-containing protein [Spirochaetia bacterium]